MPGSSSRNYLLGPSLRRGHEVGERVQSSEMGTSVLIMQPILRFLQLLCENHNRDLQVSASHTPPLPLPAGSMWTPMLAVQLCRDALGPSGLGTTTLWLAIAPLL